MSASSSHGPRRIPAGYAVALAVVVLAIVVGLRAVSDTQEQGDVLALLGSALFWLLPKYLVLAVKSAPKLSSLAFFGITDAVIVLGVPLGEESVGFLLLAPLYLLGSLFVALMMRSSQGRRS